MEKKCNNYEGYFVFASEEDFQSHLFECEDCQEEQILQNKISSLIKEAAPEYKKKIEKTNQKLKLVSCLILLIFSVTGILNMTYENKRLSQTENVIEDNLMYDMGLPVDEYGLLKI